MQKLNNYAVIKRQGYTFYNLTCGLDKETKNELLESYLTKFSSDSEAKVFINTVLYPFDTALYLKLMSLKADSYDALAEELNINDKAFISEKINEYAVNHFEDFLSEYGMKIDNPNQKHTKKSQIFRLNAGL